MSVPTTYGVTGVDNRDHDLIVMSRFHWTRPRSNMVERFQLTIYKSLKPSVTIFVGNNFEFNIDLNVLFKVT